jgi:uncharacterized protein YqeY
MQAQLRADLKTAILARDRVTVSALRSALAAIGNAEAGPLDGALADLFGSEHIAGASLGVGSTDMPRGYLTDSDVRAIVEREVAERTTAAAEYERLGRPELAEPLRAEAVVLTRYLSPT